MRPEDLREFASRNRAGLRRAKREFWSRAPGDFPAFEAGQQLYEHARACGNFPTAQQRADDLAHHVRLTELLSRASQAIARRRAPG